MKYEETPDWQNLNDIIAQMSDAYAHNISVIPKYIPMWWNDKATDMEKCKEIDRVMTGEREPSRWMWAALMDMMQSLGDPYYDDIAEFYIQFCTGIEIQKSRIIESRLLGIPHDESAMDALKKLERRFKYIRTRKANELAKAIENAYLGVVRGMKRPVDDYEDGCPTKEYAVEICRFLDEQIDDMAEKLKDPEPGMKETFDELIWKLEDSEFDKARKTWA